MSGADLDIDFGAAVRVPAASSDVDAVPVVPAAATGERYIVVNGWERFQHRDALRALDGAPRWVKAHTALLHKDEYLELSLAQRGLLHGIWLLYAAGREVLSETRARTLARTYARTGARTSRAHELRHFRDNLEALVSAGFITFSASKPASTTAGTTASLEVEKKKRPSKGPSSTPPASSTAAPPPATPNTSRPYVCRHPECHGQRFARENELADHLVNLHYTYNPAELERLIEAGKPK